MIYRRQRPDEQSTAISDEPPADQTPADVPEHLFGFRRASEKVKTFPHTPGVYLKKDASGLVIYIGKAKDLRNRAGSYFLKAAQLEERTAIWIHEICDIDYMECESEVDALLAESRLIKDIQPKYNKEQKDSKTFPYLMISTREDFPRVEVTRQPESSGVKLYGPFTSAGARYEVLFKFCNESSSFVPARWTSKNPMNAGVGSDRACWHRSRSVQLPAINASPKTSIDKTSKGCRPSWKVAKRGLVKELQDEMRIAAKELKFEKAARLRDR